MSLNFLINKNKKDFNIYYKKILNSHLSTDRLSKSMIYGSMNGGKRIRPFLCRIFGDIGKVNRHYILRLASAIENIHSYSLIHDDLPSMDNDDYRRGKYSTHKKFDEATAILAGDALHGLAFEILSNRKTHPNELIRNILVNRLSKVIGSKGLAGGQSLDLLYENKNKNLDKILKMYEMKTAALFSFTCAAPLIMANKNKNKINFASEFGKIFGLIFQITDDILDQEKDFKILGKTPGKDKKQGKSTLISIFNKEKLIKFSLKEIEIFKNKNKGFFNKNPILDDLMYFNINNLY